MKNKFWIESQGTDNTNWIVEAFTFVVVWAIGCVVFLTIFFGGIYLVWSLITNL